MPDSFVAYFEASLWRLGVTVDQLADTSGISPSVIYRWRHGYVPNIDNARKYARAIGVPLMEVLIASGQVSEEEARIYADPGVVTVGEASPARLASELAMRLNPR